MKILHQNYRGDQNATLMNNIHVLININNPSVLAPTETGMVDHETNFDALNFIDVFEVPTIGYLGGITLLWKISAITIERFVLTEKEIHSIIEVSSSKCTKMVRFRNNAKNNYCLRKIP